MYMFSLDKIQWKSTLTSFKVKNFRDTVGPRHALPDSLLDMFHLFFTTALLEYIVLQTNQYALECMGGEKYTNWSPLTVKELEAQLFYKCQPHLPRWVFMAVGLCAEIARDSHRA